MTTWTMDQVRQVRSLRAAVTIDAELADRYGDAVLTDFAYKMAKQITDIAHPIGVEVDPACRDDFEIVWENDEAPPWQMRVRLRWNPSTRKAELRGGPRDGERIELRSTGEPFRVARLETPIWAGDMEAAVTEIAVTYELVGWREDEHVWVYEARP